MPQILMRYAFMTNLFIKGIPQYGGYNYIKNDLDKNEKN